MVYWRFGTLHASDMRPLFDCGAANTFFYFGRRNALLAAAAFTLFYEELACDSQQQNAHERNDNYQASFCPRPFKPPLSCLYISHYHAPYL
jgi:hypothetical protein